MLVAPEYDVLKTTLASVRARHTDMTDTDALKMALMLSVGSDPLYNARNMRHAIGGYSPSLSPAMTALVATVMQRCHDDVDRAALMACEYLRLVHHISDTLSASSRKAGPQWTTVLTIFIGDEERLDVVDHFSVDGDIPVELAAALYV